MSQWFEVFDNEQVQLLTRKQAAGMFVVPLSVLGVGLLTRWWQATITLDDRPACPGPRCNGST